MGEIISPVPHVCINFCGSGLPLYHGGKEPQSVVVVVLPSIMADRDLNQLW